MIIIPLACFGLFCYWCMRDDTPKKIDKAQEQAKKRAAAAAFMKAVGPPREKMSDEQKEKLAQMMAGGMAYKMQANALKKRQEAKEAAKEEDDAASKIQGIYRGRSTRKEMASKTNIGKGEAAPASAAEDESTTAPTSAPAPAGLLGELSDRLKGLFSGGVPEAASASAPGPAPAELAA